MCQFNYKNQRYAVDLVFVCPLGDLIRRRQLLLVLMFTSRSLPVGLALTKPIVGFEILSFFVAIWTATPQSCIAARQEGSWFIQKFSCPSPLILHTLGNHDFPAGWRAIPLFNASCRYLVTFPFVDSLVAVLSMDLFLGWQFSSHLLLFYCHKWSGWLLVSWISAVIVAMLGNLFYCIWRR